MPSLRCTESRPNPTSAIDEGGDAGPARAGPPRPALAESQSSRRGTAATGACSSGRLGGSRMASPIAVSCAAQRRVTTTIRRLLLPPRSACRGRRSEASAAGDGDRTRRLCWPTARAAFADPGRCSRAVADTPIPPTAPAVAASAEREGARRRASSRAPTAPPSPFPACRRHRSPVRQRRAPGDSTALLSPRPTTRPPCASAGGFQRSLVPVVDGRAAQEDAATRVGALPWGWLEDLHRGRRRRRRSVADVVDVSLNASSARIAGARSSWRRAALGITRCRGRVPPDVLELGAVPRRSRASPRRIAIGVGYPPANADRLAPPTRRPRPEREGARAAPRAAVAGGDDAPPARTSMRARRARHPASSVVDGRAPRRRRPGSGTPEPSTEAAGCVPGRDDVRGRAMAGAAGPVAGVIGSPSLELPASCARTVRTRLSEPLDGSRQLEAERRPSCAPRPVPRFAAMMPQYDMRSYAGSGCVGNDPVRRVARAGPPGRRASSPGRPVGVRPRRAMLRRHPAPHDVDACAKLSAMEDLVRNRRHGTPRTPD